jgi:hypothetical protein
MVKLLADLLREWASLQEKKGLACHRLSWNYMFGSPEGTEVLSSIVALPLSAESTISSTADFMA